MLYKNIYRLLIISAVLSLSACQGVLERNPKVDFTLEGFFQTEQHAILATNSVYSMLRNWEVHVFSYIGMTDIASDDADKGSFPADAFFLQELDDFTLSPSNLAPLTVWQGYYRAIYRANLAIERIPDIEMNETLKARLIGECKFLRAYYYFNLVRWFGDLPLVIKPLTPDEFAQDRQPADAVYTQIIQDLQEALSALPEKSQYKPEDLGRATKGAARGMLARVYLTRGDFANAEKYALEVISSGQYSLYPNFAGIFLPEGENSSESVFEAQATALEAGGGGSQYNEVQGVRGTPNLGWGFNRPSDDLVRSFEQGDPRRDLTILYPGEPLPDGSDIVSDNPDIINERYNQKAWVPEHPGGNGNGPGNIRMMRYAEILLIAAEALNENGKTDDALKYINLVRARARGSSTRVLPDIMTADKAILRQKIWQERRSELAMEQQRWFDILRQGRAADLLAGKGFKKGKNELFPIPQIEIDLSSGTMSQNPGY